MRLEKYGLGMRQEKYTCMEAGEWCGLGMRQEKYTCMEAGEWCGLGMRQEKYGHIRMTDVGECSAKSVRSKVER